jgi:cell volume regulation protein A
MSDTQTFGLLVLVTAGAGLVAVVSNRVGERVKVPLPAFFLAAAAVAKLVIPDLHTPPQQTVERVVTVALVLILFDGGQHIGRSRFRAAAGPIAVVGVLGTFLTVAAAAVLIHFALSIDWYIAVLIAAAVAPTDPAIVFSVLGKREIAGRSSTILEGEAGVNDPVGIALMSSLVAAGGLGAAAFADVGESFAVEMVVGATIGIVGGRALLWFMRHVPLPSEGLYPLRTLASVMVLFGATSVVHGSGFLAVFVAGISIGDARAPYKLEVERFHAALAGLGEIVAFILLGLTVDLDTLARVDVWLPGLLVAGALALVIRPLVLGLCLRPARLNAGEQTFVLFAGLKGAVPILLGTFILGAGVPDPDRAFGIVVVVVVVSVVLQGSLVPTVARHLQLPMRTVEPEPWALGVRLRDEPDGVHRLTITPGAPADGRTIQEITALPEDAWISLVVRDLQLVQVGGDTRLRAGDELLVLADAEDREQLAAVFHPARLDSADE